MRRLLPEWVVQSAVLLAWPDEHTDWAPVLAEVRQEYCELINAIAQRQPVLVLVRDTDRAERMRQSFDTAIQHQIVPVIAEYDDTWIRDYGPLALSDGRTVSLADFSFDGWGGKFDSRNDDAITRNLHASGRFGKTQLFRHERVLEGGALDTEGSGVALCNRDTFAARDPNALTEQLESLLQTTLGIDRVLWIHDAQLAGDDTDGHVDTLARFADVRSIVFQGCDDPGDEHYAMLRNLSRQLSDFTTPDGSPYVLHALPWPQPVVVDGQRLPASYANFLIINDAVLVPGFGDPADARACEAIQDAFPHRQIVSIPSTVLLRQSGGLHCATMQLPLGATAMQ